MYKSARPLKQHEIEFGALLKDWLPPDFQGNVLDIGCATGNSLSIIKDLYPQTKLTGIDIDADLLSLARLKLGPTAQLEAISIESYQPNKNFQLIIASGVLSIFDDFSAMLNQWIDWLDTSGVLYIFGRFNTQAIDTMVRFRNLYNGSDWETGLTAYSTKTISKFLEQRSVLYSFKKFALNEDMPKSPNPIRTFTIKCEDGSRLVVNGANLIAEHYHLFIKRE